MTTEADKTSRNIPKEQWSVQIRNYETGQRVSGTVSAVKYFGAFIELEPGLTGLLHVSALSLPKGTPATAVFKEGQTVTVKILSIDEVGRLIDLGADGE